MTTNADEVIDREEQELLKQRAEKLAQSMDDLGERRVALQVAVVSCGDERFGIPAQGLRELIPLPAISPLPGLPGWMPGVTHVRGEVLAVVDLARWYAVDGASKPTTLAIVQAEDGPLGLLVDEVLGFRSVFEDEVIQSFSGRGRGEGHHVKEVTEDLVAILDLEALAGDRQLIVTQK